jgi:hypothetical protein
VTCKPIVGSGKTSHEKGEIVCPRIRVRTRKSLLAR